MRLSPIAPFYVHPAENPEAWRTLTETGCDLGAAVVNVSSGPGEAGDHYYSTALAHASATPLVGYVSVAYGARLVEDVLKEAKAWATLYGIDRVLLDCVPRELEAGAWSLDVIDRMRDAGIAWVAVNPGTPPARELIERADVTCVREASWADYQSWTLPGWLTELAPEKQWHLIYSCPQEAAMEAADRAAAYGAGNLWVTPGAPPSPWSTLPTDWAHPAWARDR